MVRFATDLDPRELPAALLGLTSIVAWTTWQQRIDALKSMLPRNPVWERFLLERHGLELALGDVRRHLRATGRCPWPPRTAEEYRVYSFIAVAVRVHASLSERGKARFAGGIRSALEKEAGFGPLAFEMKMVAHLMSRGFDVEFQDLESGGGYDFLARRDSIEIEVECKHLSADIGRQIHRLKIYDLGGVLYPVLSRDADLANGGQFVQVTLPGRLTGNKTQQDAIAQRIEAILSGSTINGDDTVCAVSVQSFSLKTSPFRGERGHKLAMKDVEEYVRQAFNVEDAHILANWRPDRAAVVVHFQSRKQDKVLDEIFRRLKDDAKRQFSGKLPAFLCVHLADLTEEQLLELANADRAGRVTGIQRAVSILLQRRSHLHSVALMADGNVEIRHERSRDRVGSAVQETGPSYVFRNPDHPRSHDVVLDQVFV